MSTPDKQQQQFEKIKSMSKLFLTVADIAPILEADPNTIRGQAQERPDLLGFPVVVCKSRVRIPRLPFIEFCEALPSVCRFECKRKKTL